MKTSNLKQHLEKKKNKIGLVGTRLELNEVEGNSIEAHITCDWKTISLNFGKELELIPDQQTKTFVEKRKIKEPKTKLAEDILDHEAGHRELPTGTRLGCPFTVQIHDQILDSITKGLKKQKKESLSEYVTNAFEDILNNINCRRNTDFSGQTLFWNNQGLVNSEDDKYSQFYEAFVKLNLIFGQGIQDTTLLRRFYTNDPKVQKAVRSFVQDFGSSLGLDHPLKLHEKPEFQTLFERDLEARIELWSDLAYKFAVTMSDLLDEQLPQEQMFGISGNEFDKKLKQPKEKQEIAHERYKAGKGPSSHTDKKEQLYYLYRALSKQIPVRTTHFEKSTGMPLVHYGKRFVTEDDTRVRFRGIGIDRSGNVNLRTSRHQIDFPVEYKTRPQQFPKLKVAIFDRSGSMALNPNDEVDNGNPKNIGDTKFIPWGDNSKFHFALKGYFGIDNFFENQGVSPYITSKVLGFSGEKVLTGNSREVAQGLLVKPKGGTTLDVNVLEKELEEGALLLSISDGDIQNFSEDHKITLKDKLSRCDYVHIQIGDDTEFSDYLRSLNVPVFKVKGDDDLSRTMIDFVSAKYRSVK